MDRAGFDRRVDIVNKCAGAETYSRKALWVPAAEGR
jgi:hypothetical protein